MILVTAFVRWEVLTPMPLCVREREIRKIFAENEDQAVEALVKDKEDLVQVSKYRRRRKA